eukprot:204719-Prymnesium_polylepis.1
MMWEMMWESIERHLLGDDVGEHREAGVALGRADVEWRKLAGGAVHVCLQPANLPLERLLPTAAHLHLAREHDRGHDGAAHAVVAFEGGRPDRVELADHAE